MYFEWLAYNRIGVKERSVVENSTSMQYESLFSRFLSPRIIFELDIILVWYSTSGDDKQGSAIPVGEDRLVI